MRYFGLGTRLKVMRNVRLPMKTVCKYGGDIETQDKELMLGYGIFVISASGRIFTIRSESL